MTRLPPILVVDDEENIRQYLKSLLTLKGFDVVLAQDGEEALQRLSEGATFSLIILDIMLPKMDGLEVLGRIRKIARQTPVIMLTGVGETGTIVKAMKLGASDYLTKPFEEEELDFAMNSVLEKNKLVQELKSLKTQLDVKRKEGYFLSVSDKMNKVKDIIEQVAPTDVTVLIRGESGVGKEIVSRSIHFNSLRAKKPFIKVNCAALPEELLESELFGFEKGAFTGAFKQKPGKFELANEGTIFLDEIAEMSPPLQAKLLQVLQDGEFSRLGGKRDIQVDVRVVAATNKDLELMVKEGRFREDLYYRLNVVSIYVPALRERKEEIPILCEYFLEKYNKKFNKNIAQVPENLMGLFMTHEWPGNVRELENMIKRIVVLEDQASVVAELNASINAARQAAAAASASAGAPVPAAPVPAVGVAVDGQGRPAGPQAISLKEITKKAALEAEKEIIQRVLNQTNWNRKKAAKILNISYKALLYKIKESGIVNGGR
ncbi:MAG TPA: sigma-54 dependent transcriptional regulator [Thermodesulfobacteriota bacterium]